MKFLSDENISPVIVAELRKVNLKLEADNLKIFPLVKQI